MADIAVPRTAVIEKQGWEGVLRGQWGHALYLKEGSSPSMSCVTRQTWC